MNAVFLLNSLQNGTKKKPQYLQVETMVALGLMTPKRKKATAKRRSLHEWRCLTSLQVQIM